MGDTGEVFNELKQSVKKHRQNMLLAANTDGWVRHTDWHFSRIFSGKRFDWWPSGGKGRYAGKMIYGHKKVNRLIADLLKCEAEDEHK